MKPLATDLSFQAEFRVGDPPRKAKVLFGVFKEKYQGFHQIFTDGSVDDDGGVGIGIWNGADDRCERLPEQCTIFSAEAKAIALALKRVRPEKKTVLFSDSASCITAIECAKSSHPWIREAEIELERSGATICWIPGHCGINGNHKADALANQGRTANLIHREVPASDRISWSKRILTGVWELKWHRERNVKLRRVKPSTAAWTDRPSRQEQRILTRLRIGHTRLTHGWLMNRDEDRNCDYCGIPLSVQHILLDCPKFENERAEVNLEGTLGEVLCYEREREERLLEFVKRIGLTSDI